MRVLRCGTQTRSRLACCLYSACSQLASELHQQYLPLSGIWLAAVRGAVEAVRTRFSTCDAD